MQSLLRLSHADIFQRLLYHTEVIKPVMEIFSSVVVTTGYLVCCVIDWGPRGGRQMCASSLTVTECSTGLKLMA
jgi:hypothetical protein